MQKALAVIVVAASLTGVGAAAAQAADPYPAPAPQSVVSQGTVPAGGTVKFSGHGFKPGEQISIAIAASGGHGVNGGVGGVSRTVPVRIPAVEAETVSTNADAEGAFTIDLVLPETGVYTLTALGSVSGVVESNQVTVEAAPGAAPAASRPDLPYTGTDAATLTWGLLGAGAFAAGLTSVVVLRRRATAS